jgi:hypothetical protein
MAGSRVRHFLPFQACYCFARHFPPFLLVPFLIVSCVASAMSKRKVYVLLVLHRVRLGTSASLPLPHAVQPLHLQCS